MGYSWGIHGIYVCIGYVSGMYRVCVYFYFTLIYRVVTPNGESDCAASDGGYDLFVGEISVVPYSGD